MADWNMPHFPILPISTVIEVKDSLFNTSISDRPTDVLIYVGVLVTDASSSP